MYNIAIVGSAGRLGTELIDVLQSRLQSGEFPIANWILIDTEEHAGTKVKIGEESPKYVKVQTIESADFSKVDIIFSVANFEVSNSFVKEAVKKGCIVIDATSAFAYDPSIAMIIPQINPEKIELFKASGIVVSPSPISVQLLLALFALKDYQIKKLVISTYQSASNLGNKALHELFEQTKGIYTSKHFHETRDVFTKQIAFNVIPQIGKFNENGDSAEEALIKKEIFTFLGEHIEISVTSVVVPVFIGNAISVHVEFAQEINESNIISALKTSKSVKVVNFNADEGYVTPIEAASEDDSYVSRLRINGKNLDMWLTADNLRIASALNMVLIAENILSFKS